MLLLMNIPLYKCIIVCLCIHLLITLVVSSLGKLWIMLLKTFICTFLCECKFLFHLGKYKRKISGHMVKMMFNFINNCQTVVQSHCSMLNSHLKCLRVPVAFFFTRYCQSWVLVMLDILSVCSGVSLGFNLFFPYSIGYWALLMSLAVSIQTIWPLQNFYFFF